MPLCMVRNSLKYVNVHKIIMFFSIKMEFKIEIKIIIRKNDPMAKIKWIILREKFFCRESNFQSSRYGDGK